MKTLTPAQLNGLRYYLRLETKMGPKFKYPDPRVIEKLGELGFIASIGFNYGPMFRLTVAGREAIKAS